MGHHQIEQHTHYEGFKKEVEKILTNNAKGLGPCLKWLSACQQADKRL
jgi:hypothetical protein